MKERASIVSVHAAARARRCLGEVVEAAGGEACSVALEEGNAPVTGHLDTVSPLSCGDIVLVEGTAEGVVVLGRLRSRRQRPAVPFRLDDTGCLVLDHPAGVVLRVGETRIELRRDGAVLVDGRSVHSVGRELYRIQGAVIEVN